MVRNKEGWASFQGQPQQITINLQASSNQKLLSCVSSISPQWRPQIWNQSISRILLPPKFQGRILHFLYCLLMILVISWLVTTHPPTLPLSLQGLLLLCLKLPFLSSLRSICPLIGGGYRQWGEGDGWSLMLIHLYHGKKILRNIFPWFMTRLNNPR